MAVSNLAELPLLSQRGMDLAKLGVPQKAELDSKIETKGKAKDALHSFERTLDQVAQKAEGGNGYRQIADDPSRNKEVTTGEAVNKEASATQDASSSAIDEDSSTDSIVVNPFVTANLQIKDLKIQVDESPEVPLTKEDVPVSPRDIGVKVAMRAPTLINKESSKAESTRMDLPPADDEVLDSLTRELESIDLEPLNKDMTLKDSTLTLAPERESAHPKLKNLVDGLWIQQNLQTERPVDVFESLVRGDQFSVKEGPETGAPMMRTNLVDDLRPLMTKVLRTNEGGEMTLKLRPGNLGPVHVEIKVDAQKVQIYFRTEHLEAKTFLQSQIRELKDQLSDAGMKTHEISVSTMSNPQQTQDSSKGFDQQARQGQERHQQQQEHRPHQDQSQRDFASDQDEVVYGEAV